MLIMRWHRFKKWRKERQEIKGLKTLIREQEKKFAPQIYSADEGIQGVIIDNYIDAVEYYEADLGEINTRRLISKAKSLGIDFPQGREDWYWTRHTQDGGNVKVLSYFGEAQLRNLIRKQKRENMEWWLKIITALTGLLGTLIGVIAILK